MNRPLALLTFASVACAPSPEDCKKNELPIAFELQEGGHQRTCHLLEVYALDDEPVPSELLCSWNFEGVDERVYYTFEPETATYWACTPYAEDLDLIIYDVCYGVEASQCTVEMVLNTD